MCKIPAVAMFRTSHVAEIRGRPHRRESGRSPSARPCEPGRCTKDCCFLCRSRGWTRTAQDAGQTTPSRKQHTPRRRQPQSVKHKSSNCFTENIHVYVELIFASAAMDEQVDKDSTVAYCCFGSEKESVLVDTWHIGGALHYESDPGNRQWDVSLVGRLVVFFRAPRHLQASAARGGTWSCFEVWRSSSSTIKLNHRRLQFCYIATYGCGVPTATLKQCCCSSSPDL